MRMSSGMPVAMCRDMIHLHQPDYAEMDCSKDSLRSIVISQRLLGTHEIAVFRHVGCGMLLFTSDQVRNIVKDASPGNSKVAKAVEELDFLEFSNLEESVKADVQFLKENPLVLKETMVTGWIYDVETGKVR
jgi:carbonic anhydrase